MPNDKRLGTAPQQVNLEKSHLTDLAHTGSKNAAPLCHKGLSICLESEARCPTPCLLFTFAARPHVLVFWKEWALLWGSSNLPA